MLFLSNLYVKLLLHYFPNISHQSQGWIDFLSVSSGNMLYTLHHEQSRTRASTDGEMECEIDSDYPLMPVTHSLMLQTLNQKCDPSQALFVLEIVTNVTEIGTENVTQRTTAPFGVSLASIFPTVLKFLRPRNDLLVVSKEQDVIKNL